LIIFWLAGALPSRAPGSVSQRGFIGITSARIWSPIAMTSGLPAGGELPLPVVVAALLAVVHPFATVSRSRRSGWARYGRGRGAGVRGCGCVRGRGCRGRWRRRCRAGVFGRGCRRGASGQRRGCGMAGRWCTDRCGAYGRGPSGSDSRTLRRRATLPAGQRRCHMPMARWATGGTARDEHGVGTVELRPCHRAVTRESQMLAGEPQREHPGSQPGRHYQRRVGAAQPPGLARPRWDRRNPVGQRVAQTARQVLVGHGSTPRAVLVALTPEPAGACRSDSSPRHRPCRRSRN